MPGKLWIIRPAFIGQTKGIIEYPLKNSPTYLAAGLGESAASDNFGIWPKPATLGASEELGQFHFHPLAFAGGNNGEDEGDEFGESKFVFSGEIRGGKLIRWIDVAGNDLQKFLCVITDLA